MSDEKEAQTGQPAPLPSVDARVALVRTAPSTIVPAPKLRASRSSLALARRVPDSGRHAPQCSICRHPQREEIERDFITWRSPVAIAREYGIGDRKSIYRHAHALGLFSKRQRNVRAALEKIIERAGDVEVNAGAVVAAVQAYAKINAAGQWVDRSEHVNLNELFERMTADELEAYARDGKLPDWFPSSARARSEELEESLVDSTYPSRGGSPTQEGNEDA